MFQLKTEKSENSLSPDIDMKLKPVTVNMVVVEILNVTCMTPN